MNLKTRLLDDERQEQLRAIIARIKSLLPWASLASGVVGAFLMDRSPKSAWLIVLLALAGWIAVAGFALVSRLDPERFSGKKQLLIRAAHFSALLVTQSLMQSSLLFALPFYVQAAALSFEHAIFLGLLVAASVATLWDPLYLSVVRGTVARFALQGFATFTALNAVLPALGLSNHASLIVSALASSAGAPLFTFLTAPGEGKRRRVVVVGVLAAVGLPLGLAFGGARVIPPAPLNLVRAEMGTALENREVSEPYDELDGVPDVLFCWTAIRAPRGLKDRLKHVWRHDGKVVDEVPLKISGGREEGFRTWSKKTRFGRHPEGRWTCSVETEAGQLLGKRSVRLSLDHGDEAAP